MTQSIKDRLQQLQTQRAEVGKGDSASELHGPSGGRPAARARNKARSHAPEADSPRAVHGDAFGRAEAKKGSATAASAHAPAPGAPAARHPFRRQLEGLRGIADNLREKEDLKRHTAQQLAAHAAQSLGDHDAVSLSVQQVFQKPLAGFAEKAATLQQQVEHLDGLLGLKDHELDDLEGTRRQLPERIESVKERLNFDQELLVWHGTGRGDPTSFFRDPQVAARARADRRAPKEVEADVFAGRQELVRLINASSGIDGATAFAKI